MQAYFHFRHNHSVEWLANSWTVQTMNFKEQLVLECTRRNSNTLAFTYHTFHRRVVEYRLKPPAYSIIGVYSITGGSNYLVRRSKIIFWNEGIHVFPNVGGQKHLVRDTKGQRGLHIEGWLQGREWESVMCEVGLTDNRRKRQVEVRIG